PAVMDPVVCDRRLLSQSLTNIVKNAVEAIEEHHDPASTKTPIGHVRADIEQAEGGRLLVHITDDGIGLPDQRENIAEPYMSTRQGGTGLGLAIVKKIVEQHYGELDFQDSPTGKGTRVTLTLYPERLKPLTGKVGSIANGQGETVPGRIRNRQDREEYGA